MRLKRHCEFEMSYQEGCINFVGDSVHEIHKGEYGYTCWVIYFTSQPPLLSLSIGVRPRFQIGRESGYICE